MRPLRLELEGFTCFREKQDPLDFENLHLFAIAGPTGAGKSSLLDAMIFALYGKVPRLKRNIGELISLGKDRMSVTFDFRLGGKDYRIARVAYRATHRSANAILEEIRDGQPIALADAVRPVEQKLQEILGLDYDTFIRAVVLPQGEFAAFLKSDASKRREILRRLLRLEVYRRMQQKAGETKRQLGDRIDNEERRLDEDYGDATRAALVLKREEHQHLAEDLERHSRTQGERAERFEELRRRRERCAEWDEKRAQLDALEGRDGEIDALADRLRADERARPLLPLFDRLGQTRERLDSARSEAQKRRDALDDAEKRAVASRQALEEARAAAEALPELQRRIEALDRVSGLFEPRDKARLKRSRLRDELAQNERKATDETGRRKTLEASLAPAQKACAEVSERLREIDYDAEHDDRLQASRDPALGLRAARRNAEATSASRSQAEERRRTAEARQVEAEEALRQAEDAFSKAKAARDEAEATLDHLREHHRVASLRQELHPGEPCPVCEQTVQALPESPDLADLEAAENRSAELKHELEKFRQSLGRAKDEATRAKVESENAARAHDDLSDQAAQIEREVEDLSSGLRRAVAEFDLPTPADSKPEDVLLKALDDLAQKRRDHAALAQELKQLEQKRDGMEREIAETRAKETQTLARVADLKQSLTDLEGELADYESRIREVTTADDPAEERRQLVERSENLSLAEREAADRERQDALAQVTAREKVESSRGQLQSAESDLSDLNDEVAARIEEAGFADEEAARQAILDDAARAGGEAEVRQHRQRRTSLAERLAELGEAIGEDRVEPEELEVARREVEDGRERETRLVQQLGSSSAALEALEKRVERRSELQQQFDDLRTRHRLYDELWMSLRSDNFEAYLLEQVFRNLVKGASVRLLELSRQRYELTFSDDAFQVIDRDNANQTRSTDTLSGGETFLASLALALELSEQVQREVGAVPLDSIFIDEGFGTLDPDTLDVVTEAIEALPDRGRVVGIITHVPELTRRLPFRVRVERRAGRSSYRIEAD